MPGLLGPSLIKPITSTSISNRLASLLAFAIALCVSNAAKAGDSAQTLPKGIVGIRYTSVFVTGLDYQFDDKGTNQGIAELNSSSISKEARKTLLGSGLGKRIYDRITESVQGVPLAQAALDAANSTLDSYDFGEIRMDIRPSVQVQVPNVMYGVTNWWSVVVSVPFIKMKTDVNWQYKPGADSGTLDSVSATARTLGVSSIPSSRELVGLAQTTLAEKGYKPIESTEKSFMGDARLMSLFKLGQFGKLGLGAMNTLGLPTGPEHDSDDLTDSGAFHHAFIEQEITAEYVFSRRFATYASGGIRYNLPEDSTFRIPKEEGDLAPDASQKETVKRQIGMSNFVEAGLKYRALSRLVLSGGWIQRTKEQDTFAGNRGFRYDVLAKTYPYTAESSHAFKAGVMYDPLSRYRPGSIPLMANLDFEQTFAGVNTPATKQLMLSLSTFF